MEISISYAGSSLYAKDSKNTSFGDCFIKEKKSYYLHELSWKITFPPWTLKPSKAPSLTFKSVYFNSLALL